MAASSARDEEQVIPNRRDLIPVFAALMMGMLLAALD